MDGSYNIKPKTKMLMIQDLYGDEKKYIIGNKEIDRYIRVDCSEVEIYKSIIHYCNGKNSVNEISDKLGISKECIYKTILRLAKIGAIVGIEPSQQVTESKNLIFKLFVFRPKKNFDIPQYVFLFLTSIYILMLIIAFLLFLRNLNTHGGAVLTDNILSHRKWSLSLESIILSFIIMIPSFIIHESFHVLAAKEYKLSVDSVVIGLYLAIFPIFYVKIKNLYTLSRYARVKIMIAGIMGNLFIISVSYILYEFYGLDIYRVVILSQVNIILININPLALTDGYFILSNILKRENIRIRVLRFIANREYKKLSKLEWIYVFFNIIYIFVNSYYICFILAASNYPVRYYWIFILSLFYTIMLFCIIKLRFKNKVS